MKKRSDDNYYRNSYIKIFLIAVIIVFSFLFVLHSKPQLTGYIVLDESYPAVKHASVDYDSKTGLVYQGVSDTEYIYKEKSKLGLQGKQKGSVNIIDYNNDGKPDLFTTGFYTDLNENKIASTNLYDDFKNDVGSFTNVKNSDSCWADFDNNLFPEPAIIGEDDSENSYFEIYKNEAGVISSDYSFEGFRYGSIACNDLNGDGWVDIIVCGEQNKEPETAVYLNNDGELVYEKDLKGLYFCDIGIKDLIGSDEPDIIISGKKKDESLETVLFDNLNEVKIINKDIDNPSVASIDYDYDGAYDLYITGWSKGVGSESKLFSNNEGNFEEVSADITSVYFAASIFYNKNNKVYLFQTGEEKIGLNPATLKAQSVTDFTSGTNEHPQEPINLNHSEEGGYLKLLWEAAGEDSKSFRVMLEIEGINYYPSTTNSFILIENQESCFNYQVKSLDASYSESEWSEKYYINCEVETNETGLNETIPKINETVPEEVVAQENITTLPVNITEEIITHWTHDRVFDDIIYHAAYDVSGDQVLVTETISNTGDKTYSTVLLWHVENQAVSFYGPYTKTGNRIEYDLSVMKPDDKRIISFRLKDIVPDRVLPTQIEYKVDQKEEAVVTEINISDNIRIEDNKTLINFTVDVNESTLIDKEVTVRQTIPKCLLEIITETAIKSGRIKATKEFKVEREDPVIVWEFDSILDAEVLQLEIDAVAEENCTDNFKTEIIAKKALGSKDEVNYAHALFQFALSVLLIILAYIIIERVKHRVGPLSYTKKFILAIVLVILIFLSFADALGLLPATLDFSKKIFSWVSMIALLLSINLADVFMGHVDNKKARHTFNILLVTSFIFLSIKNIIHVAFEIYGSERWLEDLMLFIIQHSKFLETNLFFAGIILLAICIIIAWTQFTLKKHSFAELLGKEELVFVGAKTQKLIFVSLLLIGFFTAIFNFLFDWFSIGIDSPLLLLVLYATYKSLRVENAAEKPEGFIKAYLRMFTHRKNKYIAFASFATIILIVEVYTYLSYYFAGIKNIYLNSFEMDLPTLFSIIFSSTPLPVIIMYAVQLLGFAFTAYLAFAFWKHFFLKREKDIGEIDQFHEKPYHPISFFFVIISFVSFLLKPLFSVEALLKTQVSGVFIRILSSDPLHNYNFHLIVLSITAVFSLLVVLSRKKKLEIIPYGMTLFATISITALFVISNVSMYLSHIAGLGYIENISIIQGVNMIFLGVAGIVYVMIMLMSIRALIGEYVVLFWEDFGHRTEFRRLMRFFAFHKAHMSEGEIRKIKARAEELQKQELEDYLIIVKIHKETNYNIRHIMSVLNDLEIEEHEKNIIFSINHTTQDPKHILGLHNSIKKEYHGNDLGVEHIIEHCRSKGWSQDDIAAAILHIKPKRKDKLIFKEIRKDLVK